MIQKTVEDLKAKGLVHADGITVFCTDVPSAGAGFMFGAIGAAVAASRVRWYVLAVGHDEVRAFDIDKRTGEYMGTYAAIPKGDISKAVVGRSFGTRNIMFVTSGGKVHFQATKKFLKINQEAELVRLEDFIKLNFPRK